VPGAVGKRHRGGLAAGRIGGDDGAGHAQAGAERLRRREAGGRRGVRDRRDDKGEDGSASGSSERSIVLPT
jgi:hypothetical protein